MISNITDDGGAPQGERARVGKIARLPRALRDVVNLMLEDGATAAEVIAKLADHGHTGITDMNVSNWRAGGFADWKRQRARLEEMAEKREFAIELVKQNEGSVLHEATMHLAASQLYEVLTDFDLQALKEKLDESPEEYAAIVNSLAKLSKQALDIEKFKTNVRERREAIEKELGNAKSKGGLTPETIEKIEAQLKML